MHVRLCLFVIIFILGPWIATGQVQSVGGAATLDVATWNIEWFGSPSNGPSDEARQHSNVLEVFSASDIDLWAVQEIASPSAFEDVLTALGSTYEGVLATQSGEQRIGFVYNRDVIQPLRIEHILTDFTHAFAGRPPLVMEALVTLPDTTFNATFVTLHMKAFSDLDSWSRRQDASSRLKFRLDFLESATNLIVLGDYNDELRASITNGQDSPYTNFMQDTANYRFSTLALEDAGVCTFCRSPTSTIDHILLSDELFAAGEAGSTDRHSSVIQGIPGFLSNTSDHVPVFTRLLPVVVNTSTDIHPEKTTLELWPNPVHASLHISGLPANTSVNVFDALGRRVHEAQTAFSSTLELDVVRLPPGVYVLRTDPLGEVRIFTKF
ncbi:MAG: hypothetical protein COV99_06190 [Bacteroidetes bacterium CG12_big_fil_rev_8_21_14_0_65_60_17]|nr:MAG: hypothetical protein COV99_06190 [Bacteroidetes bacterium CG12_big_fil_rev_8_21_14_0_65_60_17]